MWATSTHEQLDDLTSSAHPASLHFGSSGHYYCYCYWQDCHRRTHSRGPTSRRRGVHGGGWWGSGRPLAVVAAPGRGRGSSAPRARPAPRLLRGLMRKSPATMLEAFTTCGREPASFVLRYAYTRSAAVVCYSCTTITVLTPASSKPPACNLLAAGACPLPWPGRASPPATAHATVPVPATATAATAMGG